jgi:purine-binding chemotaxis protein CheW
MENFERYLQFFLGNENYAVKLLEVQEVIPVPETTALPNSPAYYVGIMNLRGKIISIVDLRKRLNITGSDEDSENAVVIMNFGSIRIGVVVDAINKVLNVESGEVSEVPEVNSQINAKYINGLYKSQDSLTVLLDLEGVLNIEDLKKLQERAA